MSTLRRELSTFDLSMIAVGATIGSGIFLTPSIIAGHLPAPLPFLGVWVIGGIVALAGALTFAELGGLIPGAGGMYVYLNRAYHPLAGFLFGWAYLLVVNTGGIAALSLAFATYLGHFIPLQGEQGPLAAIAGLALLTLLNIVGIRAGARVAAALTVLKLGGLTALIIAGLQNGPPDLSPGTPAALTGDSLAAAMVGVLWSFGGWQHASFTTAEARDPARSVPRAMLIGAALVTAVYLLANVAYLSTLSTTSLANSPRPAAEVMTRAVGPAGGGLIAGMILLSVFGSVSVYTLTAPRIYLAMAADGTFFRGIAAIHPRFRTPAAAILLQSAWATVLILFWQTFDRIIAYVVFTDWIFFGLTGAAVLVLRKRLPGAARPYTTPGYPFTPLLFTGVSLWFVLHTLVREPLQALAGIGLLAAGVPVYLFWKRRHASVA